MAKRAADTCAGLIATDSCATGYTPSGRLANLCPSISVSAAVREITCNPRDGPSCEARLVPRLLRFSVPTVDTEAIKTRPLLAISPARYLNKADEPAPFFGSASAVQITSREPKEADDKTRTKTPSVGSTCPAGSLVTAGPSI